MCGASSKVSGYLSRKKKERGEEEDGPVLVSSCWSDEIIRTDLETSLAGGAVLLLALDHAYYAGRGVASLHLCS